MMMINDNGREHYTGVIPWTLQEEMVTMRWQQNKRIIGDIWDVKTPKIRSLEGQVGHHAIPRECKRRWWWNEDAAIMCQLEEEDDEKEEKEMQQQCVN